MARGQLLHAPSGAKHLAMAARPFNSSENSVERYYENFQDVSKLQSKQAGEYSLYKQVKHKLPRKGSHAHARTREAWTGGY